MVAISKKVGEQTFRESYGRYFDDFIVGDLANGYYISASQGNLEISGSGTGILTVEGDISASGDINVAGNYNGYLPMSYMWYIAESERSTPIDTFLLIRS